MLYLVAVVRTDVSEERITSVVRLKKISELGTTLAVGHTADRSDDTFVRNVSSYKTYTA
jgi:hypothetical protein